MGRKHETRIIAQAGQEADAIIRGENDPQAAAEKLEDLIDYLGQAEDRIRSDAVEWDLPIRPRRQVNFPDPRAVMQAAREIAWEEAHEMLGIEPDGGSPETGLRDAMDAAVGLEELVSGNTWLGRREELPSARLAAETLKSINREIALESLDEMDPDARKRLIQAAMAEITGE